MKPTTTLTMAKTHLARAKSYLIVPQEWLNFPKRINWKNGFLVLKTRKSLPHIYSRWVMGVSETSSNPSDDEINSFNLGFSDFVQEKINILLPIETQSVKKDS